MLHMTESIATKYEMLKGQIDCAIYARVSTDRQGESIDHQISLLREISKVRGDGNWNVKDEFIYEDSGVSATRYSIWERPAMRRLIADAEKGLIHVVMFKGVSRFARNTQEALDMLDRLKAKGLRVISEEENYDSAKENSNFMFTMHAAIAEYEAEKLSVRIRLGMKEKAKSGEWCGGRIAEGYARDDNDKIVVDEERRQIIELIFDLYVNKKLGTTKIAENLNMLGTKTKDGKLWNQLKISRLLKNPIYIGNLVYNKGSFEHVRDYESNIVGKKKTVRKLNDEKEWVIVEQNHEAIVSKEVFQLAQSKIKKHANKKYPRNAKHPLTGVIYCGNCGKAMNVMKRNTKYGTYRYYMCSSVIHYGRKHCKQPNINADNLEEMVLLELQVRLGRIHNNENFWRKYIKVDADTADLQKRLDEVEKNLDKNNNDTADLYFQRKNMTDEQYGFIQQQLKGEAMNLKERKKEIEQALNNMVDGASHAEELKKAIDDFFVIDVSDKNQTREMFQTFLEKMVVKNKDIIIKTTIDNLFQIMESRD